MYSPDYEYTMIDRYYSGGRARKLYRVKYLNY